MHRLPLQLATLALLVLGAAVISALASPLISHQMSDFAQQSNPELTTSYQHRVPRQIPGIEIFTRMGEAFREHVEEKMKFVADILGLFGIDTTDNSSTLSPFLAYIQKQERVMDFVDQVGKVLGGFGDSVHQAVSDTLVGGDEEEP